MAFISVQTSHKALSDIELPIAATTVTPTSDSTSIFKNPNTGIQTNDIFEDATNISLATANPLGLGFGAHYRHHFWTEFETVEGVRDFSLLLQELDQAHSQGQVVNIKISEQEPPSGFHTPTFAYNYAGWIADYDGNLNYKYAYFGNSDVLDAWFAMHAALYAIIKDHPAFGMIDIGWGAYMENTYSDTVIVSINGSATPGTVGQQIPDLTYAQGVEYYNRATNVYPANKICCYPEQSDQYLYATGTRKTAVRADSYGYRSAATVQCTDSAGANYGKQFMCRTYAETFAGIETIDTPYSASNPRAWQNGILPVETWDFLYRFSVTVTRTPITFDLGTDVVQYVAHGFVNTDTVRFFSTGRLPYPLLSNTTYYVVNKNNDDFQVSLTSGGAAINLSVAGTGTALVSKGTDSSASWVGGGWDYASSFNWAISNHVSVFNMKQKFDVPTSWVTRFRTLLRSCGYRYRLTSFSYPTNILAGRTATFTQTWRNSGNAPHYGNCVIYYRLRNTTTNAKYYLSNNVALNFLPQAIAGDKTLSDSIAIPTYIPAGIYEIAVAGADPKGKYGRLKLAMAKYAGSNFGTDFNAGTEIIELFSARTSGELIRFLPTTYGTDYLPQEVQMEKPYYIVNVSGTTAQIATSPGGSPISFTSAGGGAVTFTVELDDGARYYPMGNMTISNPSVTTDTSNLSAHFDGTTLQYGRCTDNYSIAVDGGLDWCMFWRVKFDDLTDNRVIISRGDPGNVTVGVTQYCLYYSLSSNRIRLNLVDSSQNSVFATWSAAPTTGVWYNIYCEFTASSGDFSINVNNGTPVTANLANPVQTVTTAARIGVDNAGIRLMSGNIGQGYIWKGRKLTSTEQTTFYNSGNGIYVPELTENQKQYLFFALYTARSQMQDGYGNHDFTNIGGVTFT